MDMDIDMDIDLDLEIDDRMEAEADHSSVLQNNHASFVPTTDLPEDPITVEVGTVILDKVHVRGLDNLSSADIKQYAGEHYSLNEFERIEWIDDTSANLIYGTAQAASEALIAMTNSEALGINPKSIGPLQLRPAKKSAIRPEIDVFIRQGSSIDVKKKGAHDASRYYLLNPDQDPRERRRQQEARRPRARRGSDGEPEYNRRHYDDREHNKRRREDFSNGFDASMYDDGGNGSLDNPMDDRRKRARVRNRNDDLFADRLGRSGGRLRGRSASPLGDSDGRMGFGNDSDDFTRARRSRQRSRSPNRLPNKNAGKELFSSSIQPPSRELFPNKTGTSGLRSTDLIANPPHTPNQRASLELFPNKRGSFSNHRRTGAFDASGSNTARMFANNSSSTPSPPRERSLAERITGRPATAPADENIRVRGAAENGIQIRGAAGQGTSMRELFPLKAGSNLGKELFGEKIKGRGAPRRKAEDMF